MVIETSSRSVSLASSGALQRIGVALPLVAHLARVARRQERLAILYWGTPNVKQPSFQWITPGGILALVLWVVASALFAFYVANFGSYNKTYGALGGVVVFLVWLWISNIVILLGAEFNAELERGRAIESGMRPEDKEPFAQPRDTRKMDPEQKPA